MNDISNIMKVKDGIVGLIVGDALGVPVEFKSGYDLSQNPITKMEGYGTYNQPAGTWSDDSAMTLATMHSIVQKQGIDYEDIMDKFVAWYSEAKYMQGNSTFDCGVTTSSAISRYVGQNTPALESGCKGERDNGNGSLMRVLPLAYVKDIDYETIENVSGLTHAHPRSKIACVLYVEMAKSMLENSGWTMEEHIFSACDKIKEYYKDSPELKHFERIFNNDLEIVSGKGYVISTFEVVVRCLLITENYADAVLEAVNIGIDTDTNAAICGGLAGIYYGFDSIPVDWVNEIDRIDEVLSLCERFEAFCDESQ
ncbi:ADP-ribosyl-[dinitrogen reductase] glycohydrolase [Methanobrevibacter thaueri]|uniref:ADP-ribosyl-[dinitrogen reductase] glycohydrolase n=2 Tax=Methanobrevibacter thaueri TaxID=190975 RepID=A0A315XPZ8_9EURY|nr:ADP-ribosyl-[dinitrogen reductase] glycohydrolase [Methanobrevibacter thaueri]